MYRFNVTRRDATRRYVSLLFRATVRRSPDWRIDENRQVYLEQTWKRIDSRATFVEAHRLRSIYILAMMVFKAVQWYQKLTPIFCTLILFHPFLTRTWLITQFYVLLFFVKASSWSFFTTFSTITFRRAFFTLYIILLCIHTLQRGQI